MSTSFPITLTATERRVLLATLASSPDPVPIAEELLSEDRPVTPIEYRNVEATLTAIWGKLREAKPARKPVAQSLLEDIVGRELRAWENVEVDASGLRRIRESRRESPFCGEHPMSDGSIIATDFDGEPRREGRYSAHWFAGWSREETP